jgi:hypothetical protein
VNSAEEVVRTRILSLAAVTAIVGARVYMLTFPQRVVLPAVRVQRIIDFEPMQLRGTDGSIVARVQVDAVALTREAAVALDEAIAGDGAGSGLIGWKTSVVQFVRSRLTREAFDPLDLNQFKVMRDYEVRVTR